ncbi:Uncharacterized protein dnm_056770 [Desulfonema magnum]|uniref:Uncharacterized protein n=1 Tax=Desulfonema magnum TaxID=45655 RepID=A0A975GQ31_9BACT|nr:Uncharacterized protein dnm_056770 [Desulfonema magnum]
MAEILPNCKFGTPERQKFFENANPSKSADRKVFGPSQDKKTDSEETRLFPAGKVPHPVKKPGFFAVPNTARTLFDLLKIIRKLRPPLPPL